MDLKILLNRAFTSLILVSIFFLIILFQSKYLIILGYIIYFIILLELFIFFRNNIYIFLISIIYLLSSFFCLEIYFHNYFVIEEFIYTILLIIVFDISSYLLGTKFGKLKILPKISPNKTLFGLISGFISAYIFAFLFNNIYSLFQIYTLSIFTFLTVVFAFLGDIIESFFKRKCNLKNSSNFLPGHGWFFR